MIETFKHIVNNPTIPINFTEWIKKPYTRVILNLNDNITIKPYHKSFYYQIEGNFCDDNNLFGIKSYCKCLFNFSKQSFDYELSKHQELINLIRDYDILKISLEIKRINKNIIKFQNIRQQFN